MSETAALPGTFAASAEQTAVETETHIRRMPHREADSEIALQSFGLYLPGDPITINGEPFAVTVNESALAAAVNAATGSKHTWIDLTPRELFIDLDAGDTTVKVGKNAQPDIDTSSLVEKSPKISLVQSDGKPSTETTLWLTLPRRVQSESYSATGIAELLTQRANKDLVVALSRNQRASNLGRVGLERAGLLLSMATGEGVGIALSGTWEEMLWKGTVGVLAGAVAAGGVFITTDSLRHDNDVKKFPAWALSKVKDYGKINWRLEKLVDEKPVITVAPQEQEAA